MKSESASVSYAGLGRWLAALVLGLCLVAAPRLGLARPAPHLDIVSAKGPARFKIEVVDTEASRERGLMYRRSMARDHGMLFDFKTPQPVMFWMRNTYIPLDMLFIGQDGRVLWITHDAKPLDETPVGPPPSALVRGVLEIDGGEADRREIHVGDRVRHAIFETP